MIEREFIRNKIKNLGIQDEINAAIRKSAGCGGIFIEKTPMGEKIIITTIRPGLVIGRGGDTIKRLTTLIKTKYGLENPQIEVQEITVPALNAKAVAKRIADEIERFGPNRFKAIGYKHLNFILKSGALGAELRLSGKLPAQRARSWRFYGGYLKKSGEISKSAIDSAIETASTKKGVIGVKVRIMHPDIQLPDKVELKQIPVIIAELEEPTKHTKEPKAVNQLQKKAADELKKKKATKGHKIKSKDAKSTKKTAKTTKSTTKKTKITKSVRKTEKEVRK